ncbi:hypothetical protein OROMI_024114 [Orobanche minor]
MALLCFTGFPRLFHLPRLLCLLFFFHRALCSGRPGGF